MKNAEVTREHREAAVATEHSVAPHKLFTYLATGDLDTCVGAHRFERIAQAIADAEARGEARNAARLVELESALDYLGCCAGVALVTPRYQADIDADNCIEAARELGWTSPTQKQGDR